MKINFIFTQIINFNYIMNKIDFKLKEKCGIYEIFNMENGKRYVGSSIDIYNRIHEHIFNLKNGKSHN